MKTPSIILLVTFTIRVSFCQTACTDPKAINYGSASVQNDESCLYAATKASFNLKTTLDNSLTESSGLIWTDGQLWSHNDSGNEAAIYRIDTSNGNVLQTVHITNYPNVDWEDIAADADNIYIGDFGNNNGNRTNLRILTLPKASIGISSSVNVSVTAINFAYSDQIDFTNSNTNFDCEALLAFNDSLYIFTKNHEDAQTKLYKLPKTAGTYIASKVSTYDVKGRITAVDISPDNKEIFLIGYLSGHTDSFIWHLTSFVGNNFFSGNKQRIEISRGNDWQTEGIAFQNADKIWISNEYTQDVKQSLFWLDVHSLLNGSPISALQSQAIENSIELYPNPVSNGKMVVKIKNEYLKSLKVYNLLGNELKYALHKNVMGEYEIEIEDFHVPSILYAQLNSGKIFKKVLLINKGQ